MFGTSSASAGAGQLPYSCVLKTIFRPLCDEIVQREMYALQRGSFLTHAMKIAYNNANGAYNCQIFVDGKKVDFKVSSDISLHLKETMRYAILKDQSYDLERKFLETIQLLHEHYTATSELPDTLEKYKDDYLVQTSLWFDVVTKDIKQYYIKLMCGNKTIVISYHIQNDVCSVSICDNDTSSHAHLELEAQSIQPLLDDLIDQITLISLTDIASTHIPTNHSFFQSINPLLLIVLSLLHPESIEDHVHEDTASANQTSLQASEPSNMPVGEYTMYFSDGKDFLY